MIRLYAGFDERESIGFHAFVSSLIERASQPVSVCPLSTKALAVEQRDGTNAFTYSRFLIPWLQDFRGTAIFVDGCDMLCTADIAELAALADQRYAVQVVKHDYKTRHPRKYMGTAMEADNADYPRKNWSSVMLINCEHKAWRGMTPDKVKVMPGSYLHRFEFIELPRPEFEIAGPALIGELPREWNWLVDEYGESDKAKLLHWTAGMPGFTRYADAPMADAWREQLAKVNAAC